MSFSRHRKKLTLTFAVILGLLILIILLGRTVPTIAPIKFWLDTHPVFFIALVAAYWIGHLLTRKRDQ